MEKRILLVPRTALGLASQILSQWRRPDMKAVQQLETTDHQEESSKEGPIGSTNLNSSDQFLH